ncbi:WD repeat-containing protein 62 isoform X2 [Ranitomeya variabilis]|uniref:WD repeat-containing protein 62 isoform X2 n=1 Tax=Ranitomeya variabilis TaxID=490064 RepID=UPI004055A4BC
MFEGSSAAQRLQPVLLPASSPPGRRRSSRVTMGTAGTGKGSRQMELEKVLGVTVSSSSSLTCDPGTGLVAYPAGCVIVLLCPKKNKQFHIFNTSSKQLSALSFSPDGKLIVSGESGHKPAVRVWDVAEKVQVSEMLGHKYGISCVCFSPNMKYVVSVGYQHDMVVNVWDWKNNNIVAKNKVSSKVSTVSFSEDSSYFVTAGHRHVKFWYLESSRQSQVNGTVPLVGRSGLLGDLHNNVFGGVACGKGQNARSTYCVSYSGVLCQFNEKRVLEKWLKLKTSSSNCLCVTEEFVFCGCEEGVIRMFKAHNLQYVTDLPRPHNLGVEVALGLNASSLFAKQGHGGHPDTSALVYDRGNQWLCGVYNDHSIYVWDVSNTCKVGKVYSALYHSSYVWNIEVYPEHRLKPGFAPGSFFTCSSDNTIRLWNLERSSELGMKRNIYSHDLYKVIYVSDNVAHLKDTSSTSEKPEHKDSKSGIRVLKIRHDGRHLASGDRTGNIRIYNLESFEEMITIEAHDGEVLCLEYSRPWTGVTLLASASRDRLIHILHVDRDYTLLQTLDDHSSSITAVKFSGDGDQLHMISCGADKSIYFRPAHMLPDGVSFVRLHHVVEKTTLYDLDVDVTQKTAAVACQDKSVRLYNISSGKQEKALKSSPSGGALLKVQMDPSGRFFATSCSNKNISIFDLQTGECVATMYGHSDIVTDMKFTRDCRRLITVSGDSCIFVWKLDPVMTTCMRHQLAEMNAEGKSNAAGEATCPVNTRRETFVVSPLDESSQDDLFWDRNSDDDDEPSPDTPINDGFEADPTFLQTNGKRPMWLRKLDKEKNKPLVVLSQNKYQPLGRWAQSDSGAILIRNFLNDNDCSYCCTPDHEPGAHSFLDETTDLEVIEPRSLQDLLESEDGNNFLDDRTFITETASALDDTDVQSQSSESSGIYYPSSLQVSQQEESYFSIEERTFDKGNAALIDGLLSGCDPDEDSQMSEAELDSNNPEENLCSETPEQQRFLQMHFDTLADDLAAEKFDNSLKDLQPDEDDETLNPRLSFSSRFLSRGLRMNQTGFSLAPGSPQMATAVGSETKDDLERSQPTPDRPEEKTPERTERRKSEKDAVCPEITNSMTNVQNNQVSEKASSSRSSFPGCWPNKQKSSRSRSYMEATASFKAKIFRSVSMGENLSGGQAEEHRQLSHMSRPLSSNDLHSLEQNKFLPAEENPHKPLSSASSYEQIPSLHQERVKSSVLSNNLVIDKLLMPPPSTCGFIPRLKKKAKSVNNLSKASKREEMRPKGGDVRKNVPNLEMQKRRSSSSVDQPPEIQDFPRRASIAELPSHGSASLHTSSLVIGEANDTRSGPSSPEAASCCCPGEQDVEVLASRCEQVVEELHGVFQKTLQTYKEVEGCGGCHEEKSRLRSLFFDAFNYIQSEMDLVGVGQRNPSTSESSSHERSFSTPTLQLLEHYSDMMLELMREKISGQ